MPPSEILMTDKTSQTHRMVGPTLTWTGPPGTRALHPSLPWWSTLPRRAPWGMNHRLESARRSAKISTATPTKRLEAYERWYVVHTTVLIYLVLFCIVGAMLVCLELLSILVNPNHGSTSHHRPPRGALPLAVSGGDDGGQRDLGEMITWR